jgi:hypothetical protein
MYATCRTRTGSSAIRAGPGPHHHVVSPQHHRRGPRSTRCSNGLNAPRVTGFRGPLQPWAGCTEAASRPASAWSRHAGAQACRKGREERASRSRVDPRPLGTTSEPPPAHLMQALCVECQLELGTLAHVLDRRVPPSKQARVPQRRRRPRLVRSGSELGGRRAARFSRGRAVEIGGGSGTSSICDGLPDAFRRGGHIGVSARFGGESRAR